MKLMKSIALAVLAASALTSAASAATITFTDRATFQANLSRSFTDTFETNLGYRPAFTQYTSTEISAVVGQTRFLSTGFTDNNLLFGPFGNDRSTNYCAGCNGSFTLFFDATTFGTANGVGGVGLDVTTNQNYDAFVTFGDNSTQTFALSRIANSFFGLTSDRFIKSIAFGPGGNGISTGGATAIDNLTIGVSGAVPEPATWAMMIVGFGLIGAAARRRQSVRTVTA
jgi:PEP-CTERM motif